MVPRRTPAALVVLGPTPAPAPRPSDRFLASLAGFAGVTLVGHVHPDPDSLGAMLGLAHLVRARLGLPARLTQDGDLGRAQNRVLAAGLGLELVPLAAVPWSPREAVVMVDSQPGTGRHHLPPGQPVHAVLDHHATPGDLAGVAFADVRPDLGATCTLVTEYLAEQQVALPPAVATALYHGIDTELLGFPREAGPPDDAALRRLYPLADLDRLAEIRHARQPKDWFVLLARALAAARVVDRLVVTWAGALTQPDQAGEVADFLIQLDAAEWALAGGTYAGRLLLSLRSAHLDGRAGARLQEAVGPLGQAGGHDRRAGGAMPLVSPAGAAAAFVRVRQRLVQALGLRPGRGRRLVPTPAGAAARHSASSSPRRSANRRSSGCSGCNSPSQW
jgi:nanoRNase/pAp phosphatase (c-di-AMP/oligoRNAs hydrolase)